MSTQSQPDLAAILACLQRMQSEIEGLARIMAPQQAKRDPKQQSDKNAEAKEKDARFCDDEKERAEFVKNELKPFKKTPWKIADRVYRDEFGPHWHSDPEKSSWRVREANRYITERYRQRELKWVRRGIYAAVFFGFMTMAIAGLAIPLKDSVFSWLFSI